MDKMCNGGEPGARILANGASICEDKGVNVKPFLGSAMLALWVGTCWAGPLTREDLAKRCDPRAIRFVSPLVTAKTEGQGVDVEADVKNAPYVTLIVTDGGDSFACDHYPIGWMRASREILAKSGFPRPTGFTNSAAGTVPPKTKVWAARGSGFLTRTTPTASEPIHTGLLVYRVPEGAREVFGRARRWTTPA